MKFTAKKDWWLVLIVWGIAAVACGQLLNNFYWLMLIGNVALISLIAVFWFGTYYVIEEGRLIVSLGITRKKYRLNRLQQCVRHVPLFHQRPYHLTVLKLIIAKRIFFRMWCMCHQRIKRVL